MYLLSDFEVYLTSLSKFMLLLSKTEVYLKYTFQNDLFLLKHRGSLETFM